MNAAVLAVRAELFEAQIARQTEVWDSFYSAILFTFRQAQGERVDNTAPPRTGRPIDKLRACPVLDTGVERSGHLHNLL